jgi:ankyrin repeat protein
MKDDEQMDRLWQAASQGLLLPADVHVQELTTKLALLRVAIWNNHGHAVTEIVHRFRGVSESRELFLLHCEVGHQMTPLSFAALHGSDDAVSALVEAKASVTHNWGAAVLPIYLAASREHGSCVSRLLSLKANVDDVDCNGYTPVARAAECGELTALTLLVAAKADVNTPDCDYRAPLFHASVYGYVSVVQALISARADVDDWFRRSPLVEAAWQGHVDVVEALVDAAADVNAVNNVGATAISVAADRGHVPVLSLLVKAKAALDVAAPVGSALCHAAQFGRAQAVSFLLESKANAALVDESGQTPLALARRYRHSDVVALLLQAE